MILNIIYACLLIALAPWLLWRRLRTGRYRQHTAAKLFGVCDFKPDHRPAAWFHGVSVGEVHLLVTLIAAFRRAHPGHRMVITSTTDTGLAEARVKLPGCDVLAWPLDFTWAVRRMLDAVRPEIVVLAEAEMWPNFLAAAQARSIPVMVINARLSPRSFARLRRVASMAKRLFYDRVSTIGVQSADYAERFKMLGVDPAKLIVTGSMKYDGAAASAPAAKWLDAKPIDCKILVAGSTHAPEESLVLDAFKAIRNKLPQWSLVVVPRHPDRFAEVAKLVERSGLAFVKRSQITTPLTVLPAVVLLDTVGELAAAWGLADLGYVGGTLDGKRGGQSMIEPAGLGVPTVFGPHVWNFRDAARRLVDSNAAIMIDDATALTAMLHALMNDDPRRATMGHAARTLVAEQQGATARTLAILDRLLKKPIRQAA
jgi:3-deoxy-D-manno-octulosonic-acid transferase